MYKPVVTKTYSNCSFSISRCGTPYRTCVTIASAVMTTILSSSSHSIHLHLLSPQTLTFPCVLNLLIWRKLASHALTSLYGSERVDVHAVRWVPEDNTFEKFVSKRGANWAVLTRMGLYLTFSVCHVECDVKITIHAKFRVICGSFGYVRYLQAKLWFGCDFHESQRGQSHEIVP